MRYTKMILVAVLLLAHSALLAATEEGFTVEIDFGRESGKVTLHNAIGTSTQAFDFESLRFSKDRVMALNRLIADPGGFHFGDTLVVPYDQLEVERVSTMRDRYRVILESKNTATGRRRSHGGDLISAFQRLTIPKDDFVRGDVLVIGDDLRVEGEVNGEVVCLFGDIRLTKTAICQRNVLAAGGRIDRHRNARVYGSYQATEKWRKWTKPRRKSYSRDENEIDFGLSLAYNRVDGVAADASVVFRSEEKFMPEFFAHYGYGFWSKRSKYRLGFEQTLFDYNHLSFGGQVYSLTKTEDEWACHTGENNLYALIAREDFRDYYEGEGGSFFLQQEIGYDHRLRLDYGTEQLRFMVANPNLWSLFGGDKKFRSNSSSLDDGFLEEHMSDYDKDESVLGFTYEYNTAKDRYGELMRSGWMGRLIYQHSSDGVGSDFDYDRFLVELRRYQPLTYRQNVNVRLMAGSITGSPPLHRLFFLGGIRTLRGYKIKEFYGSRMVLANLEYVIDFPATDLGITLLFDIGKTGWDSDFLSEEGWTGDVGAGAHLGGLRLELTRQFNSPTDDLQFSLLIGDSF